MGRMGELIEKHGKVAVGVHLSISTATVAAHYVAIKKNVDFVGIFHRLRKNNSNDNMEEEKKKKKDSGSRKEETKSEILVSSVGAMGMALLCNKALYPVRAPITHLLTPPLSRLFARFHK